MSNYKVLYYKSHNGKSEVVDFIFKSTGKIKSKISNQVKHLKEFGLSRINPSIRKLTNTPLWEVRILGRDNIRMFCCAVDSQIVIFHVFFKKQQKTSTQDIKLALKRYYELVDR